MTRFLSTERRMWMALAAVLSGRAPRAGAHGYLRSLRPLIWCALVIVVVEVAAVEFVLFVIGLGQWGWVITAMHLYALLWLVALWAAFRVYGHRIEPHAVVFNDGPFGHIRVPLEAITDVRRVQRLVDSMGRTGIVLSDNGTSALLCYGTEVNVQVELSGGAELDGTALPALRSVGVNFDDPAAFVAAVANARTRQPQR